MEVSARRTAATLLLAVMGLCAGVARAEFTTLWTLGATDGRPSEFGDELWGTHAAPGSASARDDDYYFAGTYPAPIGVVAVDEPITDLERAVSEGSPVTRVHFNLSAAEATPTLRVRLTVPLVWGGWWDSVADDSGRGFGSHVLEVRFNGSLVATQTHAYAGVLVVEANAGDFTPVDGENIVEIRRTGGTVDGWIQFDSWSLEIHPEALMDGDSDNLPRWWEEDQGLNDANAADATSDGDDDGLDALGEFAAQTLVAVADTDGDGLLDGDETVTSPTDPDSDDDSLLDGEELAQSPPLDPTTPHSDTDGAVDAWELRTGFNGASNASTPPAFSGAIGLNFVSENRPESALPPLAVTGYAPQMNWNNTWAMNGWNAEDGSNDEVVSPSPGNLVDASGAVTATTVAWVSPTHAWSNSNGGNPAADLMSGYLDSSGGGPVSITFYDVPYTNYDVIAYVGGPFEGSEGYTILDSINGTERYFRSASPAPQDRFFEAAVNDMNLPRSATVVRYSGLTASTFTVQVHRLGDDTVGLHAIQIVDSTVNTDGDVLPEWFELAHRLDPFSAADVTLDSDGDGSNHGEEFQRGTSLFDPDTDGDDLLDGVETHTGTWVSATDTGTDPLVPDSDGDGLGDGEEVHRSPSPTNPNLTDTDSDGRSDLEEANQRTNPLLVDAATARMPVVTTSPRTFEWVVDDVQIVWDHTKADMGDEEWGDNNLMRVIIRQDQEPDQDALAMGLRTVSGHLTHFLYSSADAAFAYPSEPMYDIWESDWNRPPADLTAMLGFSGCGPCDISARLTFRVIGSTPGPSDQWSFDFEIINQDTTQVVVSEDFSNSTLASAVHNGSVTWGDSEGSFTANRFTTWTHDGVVVHFDPSPLESLPMFAAWRDSDDDGMTDAYEDANGLDKNDPADALLDGDGDGLINRREAKAGTLAGNPDSDGDGANDGVEVAGGSDPTSGTSLPPYYRGLPPGAIGDDLNGNGLPDAWELWAGSFALTALGDSDGDGESDGDEAIAGTNPFDPEDRLWSEVLRSGEDLIVCWPMLEDKIQQVWWDDDMQGPWNIVTGQPVLVEGEQQLTIPGALSGPGGSGFYEVRIADVDGDNDGLSDWAERHVIGSDSASGNSLGAPVPVDSDGDGTVDSSLSGDMAQFVARMEGSGATGGFADGGSGSGSGMSREQASRFLMQATFGPTMASIEALRSVGFESWITNQQALPPTLQSTYAEHMVDDFFGPRGDLSYNYSEMDDFIFGNNLMTAFARAAIQGEDQLRQRVAFALSQILVTSRRDANLQERVLGMSDYYDIFVRHAFGNYFNVLMEVTLHPVMGRYLSHVGNQKANPSINQFPDENYAREVMQLFTIGLWELNPDGTRKLDGMNNPIPTYSNQEITEMARVLTGLWFGGFLWGQGGWTDLDHTTPMTMHADRHDFGRKQLLDGFVIPARPATEEDGMRDIRDAIRHLFDHPNTGPFVGRQLIQFLVTDNPSPAYVQRVAAVFADNGSGIRGDLGAVIRAILLDEEARDPRFSEMRSDFGRLKEPVIRMMSVGRVFGLIAQENLRWWDWGDFYADARQEPTYSPSVFNFYRPAYRAPGLPTQFQLDTPVFQITDSYSSIAYPNRLWETLSEGFSLWEHYRQPLDFDRLRDLAEGDPGRMIDRLNLLFCAGRMSAGTRSIILDAVQQLTPEQTAERVRVATYLALTCPEGAVMK